MEQVKIGSTSPDRINTSNDLQICHMILSFHKWINETIFFNKVTFILIYGLNVAVKSKLGSGLENLI